MKYYIIAVGRVHKKHIKNIKKRVAKHDEVYTDSTTVAEALKDLCRTHFVDVAEEAKNTWQKQLVKESLHNVQAKTHYANKLATLELATKKLKNAVVILCWNSVQEPSVVASVINITRKNGLKGLLLKADPFSPYAGGKTKAK